MSTMKIPKVNFPFDDAISRMKVSPDELNLMETLARENKLKELEDFVNKKTIYAELNPETKPGLSTRDFMAYSLGGLILQRHPELKKLTMPEISDYLKDKMHPGLRNVNDILGISNQVRYEQDPTASGSFNRYRGIAVPASSYNDNGDLVNRDFAIQSGYKNVKTSPLDINTIAHEHAHNIDDVVRDLRKIPYSGNEYPSYFSRYSQKELDDINKFIDKNKKLIPLLNSKTNDTTSSELSKNKTYMDSLLSPFRDNSYSKIIRVPNVQDYDFQKGEFGSDIVETPISKYKEVGGEHHIDRPFSLQNFINLSKGNLGDIVQTENKFDKLRKRLA